MRAVLDQVGYASAIASGATNPKQTYFPFADDPAQLEITIKGRCKNLPPEIVAVFRSFKPYKGGNDALWALNKLRQGIHTTLVPFGIAMGGMHIAHMQICGGAQLFAPTWNSATNEITFMRTAIDAKFDYKIRVSLNVALGDIDILKNVPAIDALRGMFGEVKKVVAATETECKRLGFWK